MKGVIKYQKTDVLEIKSKIFEQACIRVFVKREDQNHPYVSGNKWWKLKYNLEEAKKNQQTLLTFGGAYSNHIYATAAAAKELALNAIGIIRGEEVLPLNPTLSFAKANGMKLHYVSREEYRVKYISEHIQSLQEKYGNFYLIPEGGTNELAVKGCIELSQILQDEIEFDYLCLPVGTGGTMAGVIQGLDESKKVIGFPVLKGAEFLESEIKKYTSKQNWQLVYDYHFGGYAKVSAELNNFISTFEKSYPVPLDLVYTAKMMFGVFELNKKRFFPAGSRVLVLHTGGLQGRCGFDI